MSTLFISAGEVSGDRYAALIAAAIKKSRPDIQIVGVGSTALKEAGADIVEDISALSSVGIIEALQFLPKLLTSLTRVKRLLGVIKPDHILVIDCQGYHLQLLKEAKKLGIPSTYFIAPQEWQWGSEKGGKKVGELVNHILSIFKEEHDFYSKLNIPSTFVGHPIRDLVSPSMSELDFRHHAGLKATEKILAIFPGSRHQELKRVMPLLLRTAQLIKDKHPHFQIVISVVKKQHTDTINKVLAQEKIEAKLFHGLSHDLIEYSHFSLTTSGTITMEHLVLERPCLVAYKFHPITYFIGLLLFPKLRNHFMALPNILAKKELMPEFLQHKADPSLMAKVALYFLDDEKQYQAYKTRLEKLNDQVGPKGAIDRVKEYILSVLDR